MDTAAPVERRTPDPRRLTLALFAAGLATFSELYVAQAVLPQLAAEFALTEAHASLAVSAATGGLALGVLPWAALADRIGRLPAMRISAAITAVCALLLPWMPGFGAFLVLRAISGLALAAIPALALAHLVTQVPASRASAIGGIYVAGTTLGGLSGRLVAGWVTAAVGDWRSGVLAVGVLVAGSALAFVALLPAAREERVRRGGGRLRAAVTNGRAWIYYVQGFCLMGSFVAVYNLLGFRLLGDDYGLPEAAVSSMFVVYLAGTLGSAVAGPVSERLGRGVVLPAAGAGMLLGLGVMSARPLVAVVAGLIVFTFAFFVAHGLAATLPGRIVVEARSQASAFYSLCYYVGSSFVGWLAGVVYSESGWDAAALLLAALIGVAALVALRARRPFVPPSISGPAPGRGGRATSAVGAARRDGGGTSNPDTVAP